jgi:hypothetical protein
MQLDSCVQKADVFELFASFKLQNFNFFSVLLRQKKKDEMKFLSFVWAIYRFSQEFIIDRNPSVKKRAQVHEMKTKTPGPNKYVFDFRLFSSEEMWIKLKVQGNDGEVEYKGRIV